MSEKRLALKFSFFLSALLLCSCDEQAASKQESTPTTKTKSEVQKDPEAAENDASPVPDADSAKQVKAQRLIAQSVAAKLIQACESFYDDYSFLPSNEDREVDSELTTTGGEKSDLMAVLVGLESAREGNPRGIAYFVARTAVDDKNGLKRTNDSAELFDPWGNPYHVVLDYDYDEELRAPDGTTVFGSKVYVWSPGPDGKHGTLEFDADNFIHTGR